MKYKSDRDRLAADLRKSMWLKRGGVAEVPTIANRLLDKGWRNYSDRGNLRQYLAANLTDGQTEGLCTFNVPLLLDDLVDLICGYDETCDPPCGDCCTEHPHWTHWHPPTTHPHPLDGIHEGLARDCEVCAIE